MMRKQLVNGPSRDYHKLIGFLWKLSAFYWRNVWL